MLRTERCTRSACCTQTSGNAGARESSFSEGVVNGRGQGTGDAEERNEKSSDQLRMQVHG